MIIIERDLIMKVLEFWPVIEPLVQLFIGVLLPGLLSWLLKRLLDILKVQDDALRLQIEEKMKAALHQAAANAVAYARAMLGGAASVDGGDLLSLAKGYVKSKNPDALMFFGKDGAPLADHELEEIILTKVAQK